MQILVAFASTHGSTREIADRIAARLSEHALHTACVAVAQIDSVDAYDAVVVGSALHNRAWLPEAAQFVELNAPSLSRKPVWLFSVGMPGALARPLRKWAAREGPKALAPFEAGIHPRGTRLFSGVVSPRQFPLPSRIVLRLMGGHYGDFRDWEEIQGWADTISADLERHTSPPA